MASISGEKPTGWGRIGRGVRHKKIPGSVWPGKMQNRTNQELRSRSGRQAWVAFISGDVKTIELGTQGAARWPRIHFGGSMMSVKEINHRHKRQSIRATAIEIKAMLVVLPSYQFWRFCQAFIAHNY